MDEKYCRHCGKEIGMCNCKESRKEMGWDKGNDNQGTLNHEPFLASFYDLDFSSFSAFISSLRERSGIGEKTSDTVDPYEYNVPIVPDCIRPEDGEKVVKQYNIAKLRTRLKFMKAEGRLMVTNRRILFRATGTSLTGNIIQEHQFNLDELGGIEIHKDYKFSILSFIGCWLLVNCILSPLLIVLFRGVINNDWTSAVVSMLFVIFGFAGILPTFTVYKRFWLKYICAVIGEFFFGSSFSIAIIRGKSLGVYGFLVVLSMIIALINQIIICFVPNLVIKIKTKGAEGAIVIGSQLAMFKRRTGHDYSGFAEVMPWEDTLMAINELGTLIDDLQKRGDYAIADWID